MQAYDPGEGTSAQARANSSPISSDDEDNYLSQLRRPGNNRQSSSSPPDSSTPDPFAGHTPADPNLAQCQCDKPDDPAAPCNKNLRGKTSVPAAPPAPSTGNRNEEPVATRSGSDSNNNPITLPQAVSPHPRPVRTSDLNRRKARPNYGPALMAIVKSHLNY